jgi:hypothetical protein
VDVRPRERLAGGLDRTDLRQEPPGADALDRQVDRHHVPVDQYVVHDDALVAEATRQRAEDLPPPGDPAALPGVVVDVGREHVIEAVELAGADDVEVGVDDLAGFHARHRADRGPDRPDRGITRSGPDRRSLVDLRPHRRSSSWTAPTTRTGHRVAAVVDR